MRLRLILNLYFDNTETDVEGILWHSNGSIINLRRTDLDGSLRRDEPCTVHWPYSN